MPPITTDPSVSVWGRLFQVVYLGSFVLLLLGIATLFIDSRIGLFMILAGMGGMFLSQTTFIVVGYRQTMRRPWPHVRPLDDEDDDW